jgi:4-aminobutyrate aminotransferase-like enzyme
VAIADEYRGRYRRGNCDTASAYADLVGDILQRQEHSGRPIGAMIVETCPSVAGQIMFPTGYLANVYQQVQAHGGLMIADEVQTGLGRLGDRFCAFEREAVRPDIVVLGKPIGNGHPLAAVVTRREIATAFDNGMEFFATFGGNTVSCAAGLAVLEVLEQESLMENARNVGGWVKQQFQRLAQEVEWIGDVRGEGFFLGLELVCDRDTRQPAASIASHLVHRMRQAGFLWGVDGPDHNVLKFRPPMCFAQADAECFVERLEQEFRWLKR